MPTVYVARSQAFQKWSADVGLTKHTYKVGVIEGDPSAAIASLNESGFAGERDWKLVVQQEAAEIDEASLLARLAAKEKPIDPGYYPKLKGARGLFKVKIANVTTQMLVKVALEGGDTAIIKAKPADVAAYLLRSALE